MSLLRDKTNQKKDSDNKQNGKILEQANFAKIKNQEPSRFSLEKSNKRLVTLK